MGDEVQRARCAIDVQGFVQGVGFRPYVHGLAVRLGLGGFVYNTPAFVRIEVEGDESMVAAFVRELRGSSAGVRWGELLRLTHESPCGQTTFQIAPSELLGTGVMTIPADLATCATCFAELFDTRNRRHGHPFINCTQCGPRATIVTEMPYDRCRTSMAPFAMCATCTREYRTPDDRRFHAQPIACSECGPRLHLTDSAGSRVPSHDPIEAVALAIKRGEIAAIKGVGGFHIVCDATQDGAVAALRKRKHRDRKPVAVMVECLAHAELLCELDAAAREALTSRERPIVLAPRRGGDRLSRFIAPELDTLGVLLPYTPVHHLLLRSLAGTPVVVTSGNLSDEPIARSEAEARAQLDGVFDCMLTHDRSIVLRCDDSVVRSNGKVAQPLRRARGHAPLPIALPFVVDAPTLAVGGHFKAVFALAAERQAVLSPHVGDLDHYAAYQSFVEGIEHFERLLRMRPVRIVHDLHDDYASTRYAHERADSDLTIERFAVQHHHAHMASCMVDNGLSGSVIGVCFDGVGLGTDGTLWGGEFLVGGYASVTRAGHLSHVRLPGGDAATRAPWRIALSHVHALGLTAHAAGLEHRVASPDIRNVMRLLDADVHCPKTSSMGRLFDAVAALTGVTTNASYEAEAALRLENLAYGVRSDGVYPVCLSDGEPFMIELAPIVCEILRDVQAGCSKARIARRFHDTIVELVVQSCLHIRRRHGLGRVVLSGGVFSNGILSSDVPERLGTEGFAVFSHRQVPANDGGLCLGQLAVAAHQPHLRHGKEGLGCASPSPAN